jgi:DNA-binding NtrC family response regulator
MQIQLVSEEIKRVKQRFGIIGNAPALVSAVERAVRVAPIDLSVLVTGESGSGKEFFPKIIHYSGMRKHKKYIAVNCGAIPEGTIDSELFGHEKGSFTGAISARKGYFEEANGGTIFLDEVAELPLTTQARLLRVLETGEFLKVGSSEVQKTDIRVVAATNVNLPEAVRAGKFREDLYYRLSTIQIHVPNLHDRGDDIMLLARKFAADFSERYLTQPISFSPEARELMMLYRWPGNVRQLKNVIEQLSLFDAGEMIDRERLAECLPEEGVGRNQIVHRPISHDYESEREMLWQMVLSLKSEIDALKMSRTTASSVPPFTSDYKEEDVSYPISHSSALIRYPNQMSIPLTETSDPTSLEDTERDTIMRALNRNGGSRKKTAEELQISERTLYRKLKEYEKNEKR